MRSCESCGSKEFTIHRGLLKFVDPNWKLIPGHGILGCVAENVPLIILPRWCVIWGWTFWCPKWCFFFKNPWIGTWKWLQLLMVQKSGVHQLRLAVYPIIYWVLYIPGGAGFLPSTVVLYPIFPNRWRKQTCIQAQFPEKIRVLQ